ncbi:MAG: amidohydrolase [Chitinophagales bacterium]|jgi:aminocarboxymuconate-semialdehyde decarboxylase|nr:amidohydrolase [Chitinophagales bacterium]HNI44589.1 amidohydrolase family protein [Chitinophagales bacterium]
MSLTKLLKIDIHTHIIPEHLPRFSEKFGYGGFIHLEHHTHCRAKMMIDNQFFREIESNCWDPAQRLHDCQQTGVGVQVLSTIPVLFNYWAKPEDTLAVSEFLNDHLAGIIQTYPKRFIGLGTLPMQAPELAVKELERCKKIGLAGVEIGSHINEWNLNDERLDVFYEAAQALEMAIFVHPWDMVGKEKMQKYWLPWLVGMPAETSLAICSMIFGGIFERYPRLRVAFAHGGGAFPATFGRIAHGFDVRPDLVAVDNPIHPSEYLGKFYVDSLVHDPIMLDYIVQLLGTNRIALGSDYPFPLGEAVPGKIIESMPYSDEIKERLLSGNALEWLRLEKNLFLG